MKRLFIQRGKNIDGFSDGFEVDRALEKFQNYFNQFIINVIYEMVF